jgi:hypothetical protein
MKREYEEYDKSYDDVTDLESQGVEEELIQQKIKRLKQDLHSNSILDTSETGLDFYGCYHINDDSTISTNSEGELSIQTEEETKNRLRAQKEMNELLGELHSARELRRQLRRSSSKGTAAANSIHSQNIDNNAAAAVLVPTTPVSEYLPFNKNPSFVYSSRSLKVDTSLGTIFPETPGSANSANSSNSSRMDVDPM